MKQEADTKVARLEEDLADLQESLGTKELFVEKLREEQSRERS